ncbi:MAG: GTPase domain-containing protein [Pirellulales bacterium]|nr:GTPase domain-containing protein [Pirellulales bacterium]
MALRTEDFDLLADVEALLGDVRRWSEHLPDWPASRACEILTQRLAQRADHLRVRLEAPLIVATLGGTGTGKSTLVNALVGEEVTVAGRQRPTTRRPMFICQPRVTPEMVGIDPQAVEVVQRDVPALRDLVLVDCPDPDTSETAGDEQLAATNLGRLRALLPHCDVLLVTATQQKYRSARVLDELATAAAGAKLVFVQTHADTESDIREDWRGVLGEHYEVGAMFLVDSPQALADARAGLAPRGEFGRLVELLQGSLARSAAKRIRRSNLLELIDETLAACAQRWDAGLPPVVQLEAALAEQRAQLNARLVEQTRDELLANRRLWEDRLLTEVAGRWGFSPFAVVLRGYQGIGQLIGGAALWRVRTPVQMALWGAATGWRTWQRDRRRRYAEAGTDRAVALAWDDAQLRTAAIIVDGYATEAGGPRVATAPAALQAEAAMAGNAFVQSTATQLQTLISRLAEGHARWTVRGIYELLLAAMVVLILFRAGKNFFYDSWLATEPSPVLGSDFFLHAGFWLLVWCGVLLAMFTGRLRRGLQREILGVCESWRTGNSGAMLFARVEDHCRQLHRSRRELEQLQARTTLLTAHLADPDARLGGKRTTASLAGPATSEVNS